MPARRVDRRLAAILAADVVGYSGLMERDEVGTLARLKAYRRELVEPLLAEHRGRVIRLMGDGALCEFGSVVDAVQCAVLIQRGMVEGEADVPAEQKIRFRIGINIGDIVHEDGDIFGDGVNIAARLEQLAQPGGIDISGTAYDHLQGKFDCGFEYLGERRLRNIKRPVRVYRVTPGGAAGPGAKAALPLPGKPAVAVLPFANLSGDPEQAYFSDGITEDVITELARFRELLVLARDSSFAFCGQAVGVREVGRALGADYVVEGSVRRAGGRVRITTQLIDATTGAHLWANRYDQPFEDLFAMEDEVVAAIAASLAGRSETAGAEHARRKPTSDLAANDCVLRGMKYLADYGENANAEARAIFERAVELDPAYARARAYLALTIYVQEVLPEAAANEALGRALKLARGAVALDDEDSRCQRILGQIALSAREFERADFHSERATTLNPNDAHAVAFRANVLPYLGRHEEAVACMGKAMRLNPLHPGWYWHMLARALHCAGRPSQPTSGSRSLNFSSSPTWRPATRSSAAPRRRETSPSGRSRQSRTSRRVRGLRQCRSGTRKIGDGFSRSCSRPVCRREGRLDPPFSLPEKARPILLAKLPADGRRGIGAEGCPGLPGRPAMSLMPGPIGPAPDETVHVAR